MNSSSNESKGIRIAAMSVLWGNPRGEAFLPWLREVKQLGYDGIGGFSFDYDEHLKAPADYKKMLDDTGLSLGSFDIFGIDTNFDQYRRTCEFLNYNSCNNLVLLGGYGKKDGDFKALGELLNYIGEIALEYSINVVYHNHSGMSGESFGDMDKLLASTDPKKVFAMVDTGHATCDFVDYPVIGDRAVRFLQKYWDRVKFIEFKDYNNETWLSTPVGEGLCDHQAVFSLIKEKEYSGWITVEQNGTSLDRTPFECAKKSREFIREGLGV